MANKKPQLPKSILDMKFMKKSKERLEKELENIEDHGGITNSNTIHGDSLGNYISQSSFIYCEDLMEGRLSFKGMNPEIERLMELQNPIIPEQEMKKDVSDEILFKKMEAYKKRKMPNSSPSTTTIKKKKH